MRRTRRQTVVAILVGLLVIASAACQAIEKRTDEPVTKVLLMGDSVIWYAHPAIKAQFSPLGVEVENIALPGLGPLYTVGGQQAWSYVLADKLATFDADIVIFESCCQYPGGPPGSDLFVNSNGVTVQPDTELMYSELAKANAELVQIARDAGASPYWVKLPPGTAGTIIYGSTFNERIDRFNLLVDSLDVPVIDWGAAVQSQPNAADLRHPDGIHYSDAGNSFLARFTFADTVKVAV